MHWQNIIANNYKTANDIKELLKLNSEEERRLEQILEQYPMSVTEYYFSLINIDDPEDPIRKMCIPTISEEDMSGTFDTSGEQDNTVITGMQHKYKETVLILSTHHCAMYCRHCFRKRLVGLSDKEVGKYYDEIAAYVRAHQEVSNVLISGGDSLMNSNAKIEHLLALFSDIPHLDFIRFGTRIPVVFPERITADFDLLNILKKYTQKKQIYVVTQFNHPNEFTEQSIAAVRALLRLGIIVKNQTVLLKGVNDSPEVLGRLLKQMTMAGIIPYYIFQCRPVTGVKNHFQIPLKDGYRIVEKAKSYQNGQGKCVKYCMSHETGKIEIAGLLEGDQMIFKYHEAKYDEDQSRIFIKKIDDGQSWLEQI